MCANVYMDNFMNKDKVILQKCSVCHKDLPASKGYVISTNEIYYCFACVNKNSNALK